jgi:hypothetical protein
VCKLSGFFRVGPVKIRVRLAYHKLTSEQFFILQIKTSKACKVVKKEIQYVITRTVAKMSNYGLSNSTTFMPLKSGWTGPLKTEGNDFRIYVLGFSFLACRVLPFSLNSHQTEGITSASIQTFLFLFPPVYRPTFQGGK